MFRRKSSEEIESLELFEPALADEDVTELAHIFTHSLKSRPNEQLRRHLPSSTVIIGGIGLGGVINAPSYDKEKFAISLRSVMEARGMIV